MSTFTRRQFLSGAAVAGAVAVAGCSDGDASGGGTVLGQLSVQNLHDEPHTVDVLVEFGDELVHWTTHELEGRTGDNDVELESTWPSEAGEFRVRARLDADTDSTIERTPADWNDPDCLDLKIEVGRDASPGIWGDSNNCEPTGDGE